MNRVEKRFQSLIRKAKSEHRANISNDGSINISLKRLKIFGSIDIIIMLWALEKKEAESEEWFPFIFKEREEATFLKRDRQEAAIKHLIKMKVIKMEIRGFPLKPYFKINWQMLEDLDVAYALFTNEKYKKRMEFFAPDSIAGQQKAVHDLYKRYANIFYENHDILLLYSNNNKEASCGKHQDGDIIEESGVCPSTSCGKHQDGDFIRKNGSGNLFKIEKFARQEGYIKHWNRLANCPNKHINRSTKVYKRALQYFKQLEDGEFWKGKALPDNYKADVIKLNKRWLNTEVIEGVELLGKMFIEGEWPNNKSKLPKDLPSLLYNLHTHNSLFHTVIHMKEVPFKRQQRQDDMYMPDKSFHI